MKNSPGQQGTRQQAKTFSGPSRHPLAALLATVIAGSAALTFTLAAVSPESNSPRQQDRHAAEQSPAFDIAQMHLQVNEIMGLDRSEIVQLNIAPDHALEGMLELVVDDQPVTFTYWPHSVRSADFRVRAQIDDGSLQDVDVVPERSVRGILEEIPGSKVAASLLDDGLHGAMVLPDGRLLWVEPVTPQADVLADAGWHVIYDTEDADCDGGTCGVPEAWLNNLRNLQDNDEPDMLEQTAAGDDCKIAQLAADADWQFYTKYNSSTGIVTNRINSIVNTINIQYENEVGIVHEITEIVIRTSSAQNPYSTNNAGSLLGQFQAVWNSQPEWSIKRDLAHLFTGRNLNGSTIGVAFLGEVCNKTWAYGLSQDLNNFGCMTDLVAHEIGHNWNATHCSCPFSTMNASLTCANTFTGSGSNSINQITAFKNGLNCLDPCVPPAPPANNVCSNRFLVSAGATPFTTLNATTDGPDEPVECDLPLGDTQIKNDVWFEYTASCTGEMIVGVCTSNYAPKLGIYAADTCPTQPGTITACDIVSCPANTFPQITMNVQEGETFIIRVGSRINETGNGTLSIVCEELSEPTCPADLNDDDVVNVLDMLIVLESWGPCPDCPADLNDDGEVNVLDLLIVLESWGDCP